MFVIETDAPCLHCEDRHEYVTSACQLCVFTDFSTAHWVAHKIEGAKVRPISEVPAGISYVLYVQKGGRPDPRYPVSMSSC